MKLILRYLKRHKGILFASLGLAIVNQVFSLLDPQIFRLIIDNYATKITELNSQDFIRGVLLLLLASVGAALASRIAKAFQDYYVNVTTQTLGTEMYSDSVAHAFSLPFSVFEDQRSGELLDKLQKARDDSQALVSHAINTIFISAVGIVLVLAYATYVHWLIGLVYFLIIPTLGTITFFLSKRIKEAQRKIVIERADLSGSTTETLRNVELVKSLGLEDQEINRLNATNEKILELELKKVKLVRTLDFIQGTMINALRSGILLLMLWLIFKGNITLGEFFSLLFYSFAVFSPLYQLGTVAAAYQEAKASNEQLNKILSMRPEKKLGSQIILSTIKSIEYDNVYFVYPTGTVPTLENISFNIKAGETIAFVGPSGSGKSTIIRLLVGLHKPTSGTIRFNNIDSREIDFGDLRKRVGLVSQETQLFSGSIKENLLFVNPSATHEECLEVLRLAQVEGIVERGDKGLDTKIGEGGMKISGGERQRLAIARALLRDPEIIVFDEATSSLDSITEKSITKIIKMITAIKPNLITVLVAHRLSTVIHSDTIHVLEKGTIIEKGNHDKLLKINGLYSALWKEQTAAKWTDEAAEQVTIIKKI